MAACQLLVSLACLLQAEAIGPTLKGMVEDGNGRPIAGARVDIATAAPRVGRGLFCPSCYRDCRKNARTDSPLIAGDKLYAPREDRTVFVASVANDKFDLLSENDMAESVIGPPVPALNCILIRGERHLFCVDSEASPQ